MRDELPTRRGPIGEAIVTHENAPVPAERISLEPAPAPADPPLRRVGKYQLLFPIARGGMGVVHAGVLASEGVETVVALKMLTSVERTAEEVEAFLREARISAKIAHKNVLSAFELGTHEGEPFLVMPLVRGVSLGRLQKALSQRRELMAPELAAWIAAQIADGLHAAHQLTGQNGESLGLVHRDVSPQNVLLGFDGSVALLDFGVAKLYESARSTETGVIKGKFGYMAPEQCAGETLDRRTDIFALGIVLHEMLTGRELFAGLPPAAATLRIATTIPDEPSRIRNGLPRELDVITRRAMFTAKEGRYDHAADLATELRKVLRSLGGEQGDAALRELLARLFHRERTQFEARLEQALKRARSAEPVTESALSVGLRSDQVTESAVLLSPRERTHARGRTWMVAALALVPLIGLGWFASTRKQPPAEPAATASAPAPSPSANDETRPLSAAAVIDVARAPSTVTPSSAAPSAAAPSSSATKLGRLPQDATTKLPSSAAVPTAASAAPANSAQFKGQPFRTW